ncbi:TauD/TfdA family dioxygenase [Reyranella sp. CPCC 100927]|uniref:TauD/TfdA dioxygenase family protein n=1 Tax=Reyranella sp. CPCC 100927 TaxID=2599616 RepID=UPI0011B6FF00|nr:TauD/TfdA family dioxygenase [Reyranella sp. CPCC 100927]TWT05059.1 TauD/TfdA family dioxygenase [Reyranella sp. CPCC 100927]
MTYETIQVRRVTGGCGAEISGVDLTRLSNRQWDEVRRAFVDHGVIFFRDQDLSPEQHIQFARRWGPIDINRFFTPVEGYPEIAEVRKEKAQKTNIGGGWHTDHSYDPAPAMGSILLAREVPDEGGDTLFASMYAAYEALSDGLRQTLEGLRAIHSDEHVFGAKGYHKQTADTVGRIGNAHAVRGDVTHPVVITHPESGRKALYVNPGFTVRFDGWSEADSKPLLEHLYRHATRPEFTCRFRWTPGALAFWDNRATWHYAANDYHGEQRLMHRITVAGCTLS